MLAQVEVWNNSFGSAWTGDRPETGQICDVYIVERQCACGKTTRKLRANPVLCHSNVRKILHLPVCAIAAYGRMALFAPDTSRDLKVWAWSRRCGGYAILNPGCLYRQHKEDKTFLPSTHRDYTWFALANQGNWEHHALLMSDLTGHTLPVVSLSGKCPTCRSAEQSAPCEDIELVSDGQYTLRRIVTGNEIRYKAGCRDFTLEEALVHWSEYRTDERARLFRAALLAEQMNNYLKSTN